MSMRRLGLTLIIFVVFAGGVRAESLLDDSAAAPSDVMSAVPVPESTEEKPGVIAETETYKLRSESPRGEGTSMGAASLQMTLGLAAVLAVILALSWLARRFNLGAVGNVANMKVVGALTVGQKEKVLMLEVENQRLLIGVTAHQISLLQVMGETASTQTSSDFANRMQTLLKAGTLNEN